MAANTEGAGEDAGPEAVEGVRFWRADGGWYIACNERQQGPFLYRPAIVGRWERRRGATDGSGAVVERFTRFDAAGEQVTIVARYREEPGHGTAYLGSAWVEEPPPPDRYDRASSPAGRPPGPR